MTTWTLHGTGRRTRDQWPLLHRHTDTWTAAWADITGFHLTTMPAHMPTTTHLWAWTSHHWLRVRIDHDRFWAALLTENAPNPDPALWSETSEDVGAPYTTRFRNWSNDREAKQYRGDQGVLGRDDQLQLIPLRPTTAPFIGDQSTTHHRQQ